MCCWTAIFGELRRQQLLIKAASLPRHQQKLWRGAFPEGDFAGWEAVVEAKAESKHLCQNLDFVSCLSVT